MAGFAFGFIFHLPFHTGRQSSSIFITMNVLQTAHPTHIQKHMHYSDCDGGSSGQWAPHMEQRIMIKKQKKTRLVVMLRWKKRRG